MSRLLANPHGLLTLLRKHSQSCRYTLDVHLFKPRNKTNFTGLQSWFRRDPPAFKDPKFVCESEGREGSLLAGTMHT
jgi:hypothetical protein